MKSLGHKILVSFLFCPYFISVQTEAFVDGGDLGDLNKWVLFDFVEIAGEYS